MTLKSQVISLYISFPGPLQNLTESCEPILLLEGIMSRVLHTTQPSTQTRESYPDRSQFLPLLVISCVPLGNKHCIEGEHSSEKPLPIGEAKRDTAEQSKETNRSFLCVMAALFSPGCGCVSPCLCVRSLPAQPWSCLCYFEMTVGKPLFKGDRYTSF